MTPTLSHRLDAVARKVVPAALGVFFVLISAIPFYLPGFGPVAPNFVLMAVPSLTLLMDDWAKGGWRRTHVFPMQPVLPLPHLLRCRSSFLYSKQYQNHPKIHPLPPMPVFHLRWACRQPWLRQLPLHPHVYHRDQPRLWSLYLWTCPILPMQPW